MNDESGEIGEFTRGELARVREAFVCASGRPRPEECPPPERIHEAVSGALAPGEVRSVIEHTVACPDCAEDWRIARELEAQEEAASPLRTDRRGWGGLTRWGAVAAAVVVALLAVGAWLTPDRWPLGVDEPPVFRQAEDGEAIRSLVPAEEPLLRDEAVLSWEGGPEDATYDLLVSTEELEPVADASGLEEPRYRIQPQDLADLPPGTELLWRVEATAPDGRRVRSPTFVAVLE